VGKDLPQPGLARVRSPDTERVRPPLCR
jgi:hypothetical protein